HIFYGSENFIAEHGSESIIYSSFVNPPDSTAGWFLRRFSVDDINGDGIDDVVVGRSFYDYPKLTAVHYGSSNGIDSIPSFTFIQDTTTSLFFSAAGVTQNIGDFNDDGYDDFIMSPAGYQVFALHFGGPYVSNGNNYGAAGSLNANDVYPQKSVNMGDQTNDSVNDIAVIVPGGSETSKGYIIMYYGQRIPTDVKESEVFPKNFSLYQNYPNPFNSSTLISWHLFNNNKVTIKIYDSLGKKVATLTDQEFSEGDNQIEFDAGKYKLASGVYFCELKIKGGETARIKMLYLK
ncbi:MAG: T9SS type A sorting domain-containing protein, partial [Ignavibacteriaceae bacterium]|nr:T9SS type A sorting domain-containing protein [Ignavibacteriaceae bacterium]